MHANHYFTLLMVILLASVGAGCGNDGPEVASVTGTVKLDGQPLPDATVLFIPMEGEGGRPGAATTDSEGKYELNFSGGRKGAMLGKNKVKITTGRDSGEDEEGNPLPPAPEKVPTKYNTQTTLEFNVEPGKTNVADFDLEADGEVRDVADSD